METAKLEVITKRRVKITFEIDRRLETYNKALDQIGHTDEASTQEKKQIEQHLKQLRK